LSDVLTLPIRSITESTPSTRLLRLDLGSQPFVFQSGQAALIGAHGQTHRRPYSIASSPDDARRHRRIEFLLKVDNAGIAGIHLPQLTRAVRVDLEGPFGSFTLPETAAPAYLFVAGGTGIAPLRAMLRHLIASGIRVPIAVLYSARTPLEFAYRGELERLARRGLIRLMLTVTGEPGADWSGERGRICARQLEAVLPRPEALSFVCGPPALVDDVRPLLRQLGQGEGRIRIEER
jgi:Na+-transporting NADH:ubiquinone oxidoreductase subunit F